MQRAKAEGESGSAVSYTHLDVYKRQALINAIVHNDFTREIPPVFEIFSDRMEFTSYGGLISGQSKEDFFSCSSMPRNRELMRVFKDVGLVEQLGRCV